MSAKGSVRGFRRETSAPSTCGLEWIAGFLTEPRSARDRERANSDPSWLEDYDGARHESLGDCRQVGDQQSHLRGGTSGQRPAKENDRRNRPPASCQQGPEVRVCRHDDPVLLLRAIEDHRIVGLGEPVLADVNRIVTALPETFGHLRREGVVDEEPQAVLISGSSRSRTASAA